ncbi:MAG: TAXI family TRAP transporter solute-binding subunit [Chloroflexaceae bacterium]|nr:TAXI family TRAP transporter solute-binding subunit [Chloroflexaceae bacterium]
MPEGAESMDQSDSDMADDTDSSDSGMSSGADPEPVATTEEVRQAFGGGPVGGAFQTFANAMALIMQDSDANLDIAAEGTGGSGENLRGVNSGDLDYGIVYAGDVYLGQRGELPEDTTEYTSVYPSAALYGGVVQLVVSVDSGIESVEDLPGKRIALGNAGSGAALSAERYFTHLGLMDQVETEFLGYSQAAQAMGDGQLDGFWILAAIPNASVTEASTLTDIRLIDVYTPGEEAGFFDEYPFYTARDIPGGMYPGNDEDIPAFQDAALLVANQDVSEDLVYNALIAIFSDEGLETMRTAHPAAEEMSKETGVTGIPVTLHPGAYRYWEAVGVDIPADIAP